MPPPVPSRDLKTPLVLVVLSWSALFVCGGAGLVAFPPGGLALLSLLGPVALIATGIALWRITRPPEASWPFQGFEWLPHVPAPVGTGHHEGTVGGRSVQVSYVRPFRGGRALQEVVIPGDVPFRLLSGGIGSLSNALVSGFVARAVGQRVQVWAPEADATAFDAWLARPAVAAAAARVLSDDPLRTLTFTPGRGVSLLLRAPAREPDDAAGRALVDALLVLVAPPPA